MSNTARSLKALRADGWNCQVVERWQAFAKVRIDLYGFIDILCMREGGPFLAVQTTSRGNIMSRIHKITLEQRALMFISCGGQIEVHGWKKIKNRWENKVIRYPKVGDE